MSADPVNCCCRWGAARGGEWPEFGCYRCPIHQGGLGEQPDELCKRHYLEKVREALRARDLEWGKKNYEGMTKRYGERPFCRVFADGLDGFVVHARECLNWPLSWTDSDRCIDKRRVGFGY